MLIQFSRRALRVVLLLLALGLSYSRSFSQTSVEICGKGIDDDGDGLIDAYDLADCPGLPLEFCTDTVRSGNFAVQLAWEPPQAFTTSYQSTPIVGNLNPAQDSIPEIVLVHAAPIGFAPSSELYIFKGDGSNRFNPNTLTVPGNMSNLSQIGVVPTIADLDGNGDPELIVICADKRIRIFHGFNPAANPCMTLWITSADTCVSSQFDVYAADFDQDGISELYAGNEVYALDLSNPAVPELRRRLRGVGPVGRMYWTGFTPLGKAGSFAADLLSVADCNGDPDCAGLELAAGYVIYSVDLDPNDGDGYQIKVQRNINTLSGQNFEDGMTTIGDVDLDGVQEVLVTSRNGPVTGFYLWNKTGYWHFFPSSQLQVTFPFIVGTKMTVGNVYDDRKSGFARDFPEIIAGDEDFLHCFNMQRAAVAPAAPVWWALDLVNGFAGYNGMHTPALFDFDQDGWSELVVSGINTSVLYGGPAPFPPGVNADREMMIYPNCSGTLGIASPAIADVDADGQAEIATVGFNAIGGENRLHVLEAEELQHSTWPSAREVWNQYAYAIVQIDDDLGVPKIQQPGQLEIPGPGSNYRPLNNFNAQLPYYGLQHPKQLSAADATVQVLEVACIGNLQFRVKLRVCNQGSVALPANLPLTFYRGGNPAAGNSTTMSTHLVSTLPILPGACVELSAVLPFTGNNVYAAVNDPGLNVFPLHDSDEFWKAECNYSNNIAQFKMNPTVGPALSLGPDIHDCNPGPHLFQAPAGFASYVWQDNSAGPNYVAYVPGTYWVQAQDFCQNIRTDTIRILADTILQQLQAATCAGSAYTFDGIQIPAGSSRAFVYSNSAGCDSTIVVAVAALPVKQTAETVQICPGDSTLVFGNYIKTAGAYAAHYTGSNGCDSLHTVTVSLLPAPAPTQEARSICPGDSTLVFGNYVHAAGSYSQHFSNGSGCDSLHTVTVNLLPAPAPTQEGRSICPGDSTLVFGNYVHAAGTYSQHFSNGSGCDSLHTVTVNLLPAPAPTQEGRSICPGDSTLVFGNYVHAAGTYSQHFSNAGGCDSLHTVTVSLLPAPLPTQETRSICPGDSTLVFGNYVHAAGTYSQHFSNAGGCDSLHTVTVNLLPAPAPTQEGRSICPGDSTLVFGNYVHAAGTYSQHFSNASGCDSLHTVTVNLLPAPLPTQETRSICPGDSTLVFGNYVHAAGTYSQHFSIASGCDSLHTINVSLLPAPLPTQEARSICPGDSTLVFGNYVHAAGTYSQHFSNGSGCDSLHTVTVNLLPAPLPTQETRSICPGDSTLVFGNYVHAAGSYSQHFSNAGGCDSLHTINVNLLPAPLPTQEARSICPGDSTLVFGNYVHAAGTYSQHFSNAGGCDSLHTIVVSESFIVEKTDTFALCPGDSIRVFGNWVQTPGTLQQVLPGVPGCDTLYTVVLRGIVFPAADTMIRQPDAQQSTGSIRVSSGTGAWYSLDPQHFDGRMMFDSLSPGDYVLYQQVESCLQELPFRIQPFVETKENQVYAPNALLPGSGNGNDAFTLFAPADVVSQILYLRIYDRWGELVFENEHFSPGDPSKGWNGRTNGNAVAPGVYVWQAMVEWKNGDKEIKKGDITVLR